MTSLPASPFEISDTITPEVDAALDAGLTVHNAAHNAPLYEEKELSIIRRDHTGRVIAALAGKTFWGWLYVGKLWVDDALRGQGVGAALMSAAEEEAKKRGCHSAYVWTESFQGAGFYPKLGYKEFTVMNDLPVGHQRIGFRKKLAE